MYFFFFLQTRVMQDSVIISLHINIFLAYMPLGENIDLIKIMKTQL